MKTRNGFVSNSSSSSFIVMFPQRPESYEDVFRMMFNSEEFNIAAYDDPIRSSQAAQTVWEDIESQRPLSRMQLARRMQEAVWDYYEDKRLHDSGELLDSWERGIDPAERERRERRSEEYYEKKAGAATDKFIRENPDGIVYQFEYEDNCGSYGAAMEHGDIFRNLPHHKISNH